MSLEQPWLDLPDEAATPEDLLVRIRKLAEKLVAQEQAVVDAEAALEAAKLAKKKTAEELLPGVMKEAGLPEIKLETGETISTFENFRASIAAENMAAAVEWLKGRKEDGIVKTQVVVNFARGELERAEKLAAGIVKKGVDASVVSTIHPMTLKSFVNEKREAGVEISPAFSVYVYNDTKVTRPKAPKAKAGRGRGGA